MPSLQTFTFEVRDGSGDTHEVTVVRYAPGRLTTHCTCAAGVDGRCCEHCLRLLAGDTTQLVSDNEVEVAVLEWWVACLDLKQTVTRVRQAQERGTLPPASISKVFAHWPELTAGDEEAQLEGTGHAMVRHPGVGALELGAAQRFGAPPSGRPTRTGIPRSATVVSPVAAERCTSPRKDSEIPRTPQSKPELDRGGPAYRDPPGS